MTRITIALGSTDHALDIVLVKDTGGGKYHFCGFDLPLTVSLQDFFISTVPVTQALWFDVMGNNPAIVPGDRRPVENVSWDDVTGAGGFLDTINRADVLKQVSREI